MLNSLSFGRSDIPIYVRSEKMASRQPRGCLRGTALPSQSHWKGQSSSAIYLELCSTSDWLGWPKKSLPLNIALDRCSLIESSQGSNYIFDSSTEFEFLPRKKSSVLPTPVFDIDPSFAPASVSVGPVGHSKQHQYWKARVCLSCIRNSLPRPRPTS